MQRILKQSMLTIVITNVKNNHTFLNYRILESHNNKKKSSLLIHSLTSRTKTFKQC